MVLYPSDSASAKTSSASSLAPGSVVVDRLPVEVVTMGTDWEACSEASAEALSVNTVTAGTDGLRAWHTALGQAALRSSSTAPTLGNRSLHQTSATYLVLPLVTVLWGRYDPPIPPRGQGIVGFHTCLNLKHRVPVTIHPNKRLKKGLTDVFPLDT